MGPFCDLVKGVVVVAVTIDVIRIEFIDIVLEVDDKISTAGRLRIIEASRVPIASYFRVNKGSIRKEINLTPRESCIVHQPVPNHNSLEINLEKLTTIVESIVLINEHS